MAPRIRHLTHAFTGGAVIAALALAAPASAAPDAYAPPPSSTDVVQATNAMMDVTYDRTLLTGPLAKADFRTGYYIPPGGQDPYPVCTTGPTYRTVDIPRDLAIGYQASNGTVTQVEYVYPSAAAGARAWAALDRQIAAKCRGSWSGVVDDSATTVTRKALAAKGAAGAGWAVTTVMDLSTTHVVVRPVDGGIQQLVFYTHRDTTGSTTMKATVPAAMNALSVDLAERWAARATLPIDTDRMTSWMAPAMLQESDVPAALPVTQPENGGWADFSANAPGSTLTTCGKDAPAGTWSFSTSLGGSGDIEANPGALWQNVSMYQTPDAAAAAWQKLRTAVLACNDPRMPAISTTKEIFRSVSGESALAYDGVPAVWSRQFMTDILGRDSFSTKNYTVHLLVDNTIQSLTYYTTRDGLRQIPLDQLAVNTLAEELADRYVAAASAAE